MKYDDSRENSLRELLTSGDAACIAYLNAAFEDGDVHYLLVALKNIIEVQYGSLEAFSQKFSIDIKALQKLFCEQSIDFLVINKIIQSFGWSFAIVGSPYVIAENSPVDDKTQSSMASESNNDSSFHPIYANSRHLF